MHTFELREHVVSVLRAAAALDCGCPGARAVAGAAAQLLREVTTVGLHVTKWRNPERGAWTGVAHEAGPVWTSVEYRRGGRLRVVDGRQGCTRCGRELVRGARGLWFIPGETVVTDEYGPHPLQLRPWRQIGGTIWEDCTSPRATEPNEFVSP